jgi:hypothetical protein
LTTFEVRILRDGATVPAVGLSSRVLPGDRLIVRMVQAEEAP